MDDLGVEIRWTESETHLETSQASMMELFFEKIVNGFEYIIRYPSYYIEYKIKLLLPLSIKSGSFATAF